MGQRKTYIPHDAAPPEARRRRPHLLAALDAVPVQVGKGHAGLDDGVAVLVVDLEDAVHAVQVQRDRPADARRRPAVPEVLAPREGPERDAMPVGHGEDLPELVDRVGALLHFSCFSTSAILMACVCEGPALGGIPDRGARDFPLVVPVFMNVIRVDVV